MSQQRPDMDSHFQDLFDQATASLRRAQECLAEFAQLRQDSGQQDNLTGSRMNESERKPARDDERSNDERASEEELRQVIIPKLIEVITLPKLIEVLLNLAHQDESSYLTEAETTTPRILFATQGCLLLIDRENAQVSVHHEEELTLEYEDIGDACFDVIDFAEARRQRQAVALRRSERRTPGWQRCGSASTLVSRRSRIVQSRVKPERESDQRSADDERFKQWRGQQDFGEVTSKRGKPVRMATVVSCKRAWRPNYGIISIGQYIIFRL